MVRHRSGARAVLLLVLALLGALLVAPVQAGAAASAPKPRVTQARPISGEVVAFSGFIGSRVRAVRLQRKEGRSWERVASGRTDADGAYRLRAKVVRLGGAERVSYRVVAPATRVGGTRLGTVVSATRTVRPLAQEAGIRVDRQRVDATTPVTWTATFSPARPGRAVRLAVRRDGGDWTLLATGVQDRRGRLVVTETLPEAGKHEVRARTLRASGAAELSTPIVTTRSTGPA